MGRALLFALTAAGLCFCAAAYSQDTKPDPKRIETASVSTYVTDLDSGQTLFTKNTELIMPIASITKLMTAMVVPRLRTWRSTSLT